jgi:hypothetical protein
VEGGTNEEWVVDDDWTSRGYCPADNRGGPRRGTSGAADAPGSGGRSWCARTLNPEGECAYPNYYAFWGVNANDSRDFVRNCTRHVGVQPRGTAT